MSILGGLTEIKFKTILESSLHQHPLIDKNILGVIYSFNHFKSVNLGLHTACKIGSIGLAFMMIDRKTKNNTLSLFDWNCGFCWAFLKGHK